MAAPQINPSQILDSYRKSDAVLIVCQHNEKKTVEIAAVNAECERVLGRSNEELVGRPLGDILPERIMSTIAEFVEYDNEDQDLLTVLNKVRNFSVKTASGNELEFKLRVIRGDAIDRNPWFHLVLVDEEKSRQASAFRDVLKENFKGHEVLDERTGLPNRLSILKDLELVVYHVREKQISATFAVIDINHYENLLKEYTPEICTNLHRHIGQICKLKLRGEDTIGTLSERSLGIILVDAAQEPARMVLNRLRWAIGSTPLELPKNRDLVAQANVAFSEIDGKIEATQVLEKVEGFMVSLRKQVGNSIQLVVTHERRESSTEGDRRKVNIPVTVERRKRDRRSGQP